MMPAHFEFWILEAAFRSLLMAVAVWAGIRMMRVQAVLAQKVAWVLVLVAAGTMPLVMRAPWLSLDNALRIPIRSLPLSGAHVTQLPAASVSNRTSRSETVVVPKAAPEHRTMRAFARSFRPLRTVEHNIRVVEQIAGIEPQQMQGASEEKPAASPGSAAMAKGSGFWNWARIKSQAKLLFRSKVSSGLRPALAMLYLVVAGILLLRLFAGLSVAFRIWRRSKPIANFSEVTLPALGTRVLRARVSRDLSTPVTIGSTVILPADYAEWDEAKLRVVLAHEQSHVRQGDFYLQLLAALHLAIFWFSPLGWWLQRKISELGEALSDRAGLEQAQDPASYAQILLEFAAMPRTSPFAGALTGVAMARSSNLSSRIERILNARHFRLAFLDGRRHAVLAATLVPAALVAVVACIRIVPAVEAAQVQKPPAARAQISGAAASGQGSSQGVGPAVSVGVAASAADAVSGQVAEETQDQVMTVDVGQAVPPAPAVAPVAPNPPSEDVAPVTAPEPPTAAEVRDDMAPVAPRPAKPIRRGNIHIYSDDGDDDDSFAIVRDGGNSTVVMNGHSGKDLERVRQQYHGNFIWFEHDGKSYVITDPAILNQSEAMFRGDEALSRRMAVLNQRQAELNKQMEQLKPEMENARLPGPEFERQMAKLHQQLAVLQSEDYKKLTDSIAKEINDSKQAMNDASLQLAQERLGELQERIGDIQGQIGEIQGKIGERQERVGERQSQLGERMGELGEEMGRIGEQQGRQAEEAARRMKSVLDQAVRDGKAKPVE
jgi:beta-lactamase regulating signal transducer with metallopeptidase domain